MDDKLSLATADGLHIALLGPPIMRWQGVPFALPRRQARALLYRLAADFQPVARDELIFLLWPDVDDAIGNQHLSRLLSYTRKALPHSDIIYTQAESIGLQPKRVWSDSQTFLHLSQAEASTGEMEEAVSLYRGPFLSGVVLNDSPEFEHWLRGQQQHFERLYLATLQRLIQAKQAAGEYETAVTYAQHYLTTDELAETVHRQIISIYAALGERAAALRQFERCTVILERELGVRPLPETRTAYEAARDGYQTTEPEAITVTWTTLPSLHLPLMGRDEALQALEKAHQRTPSGSVTLIYGEAGIGKSRLMQAFADSHPQMTLVGNAYASAQPLPYQPIIQALRQAVPHHRLWLNIPAIWRSELQLLLPELREQFDDLVEPLVVEPEQAQARLFETLTQVFTGLAANAPLLFCLDDLHWADEATLNWLDYLAGRLKQSNLQVMATCRQVTAPALSRLRHSLQRHGLLAEVRLQGFTPEVITALLGQLPQQPNEPTHLAARLYQETDGNPFFVLEIIRELLEEGQLDSIPKALPLPRTVANVIGARLARLTPLARQVLESSAVLAPFIEAPIVQRTAGHQEMEIMDGLDELVERNLLLADPTGYRFRHDLIRTVVYQSLSLWRQRALHRRTAEALGSLYQEEPVAAAQIARHYDLAGEVAQAFAQYRQAVAEALRVYAHEAAITYLQHALDLLPQLSMDTAVKTELHESLGDTLRLVGQYEAARAAYEISLTHLGEDDSRRRAELHRKTGTTYDRQSRYPESEAAYQAALVVLGAEPTDADHRWWHSWLEIQFTRLDSLYFMGNMEGLNELANRLQPVVVERGTAVQQYKLMVALSQLQNRQQRFRLTKTAVRGARDRLAMAATTGDPLNVEQSRFSLGFHLLWSGTPEQAIPHLIEALARSEAMGDLKLQNQCSTYLSIACRLQGQVALVREYSERSSQLAQRLSYPPYIAAAQANFAWLHFRAEQWPQAEEQARAALALWKPNYPLHWLAWWILLAGHLRRNELDEAIVAAAAMLAPEQQRLPDEVTAVLEQAVLGYQNGEIDSLRHHLSTALDVAYTCGYL